MVKVRIDPSALSHAEALEMASRATLHDTDLWPALHRLIPEPSVDIRLFGQQCRQVGLTKIASLWRLEGGGPLTVPLPLFVRHMLARWAFSGLPIFELTHSFMAGLALTDPSGVAAEEVQTPYPTFKVHFPSPFWEMSEKPGSLVLRPITVGWVHCLARTVRPDGTTLPSEEQKRKWLIALGNRERGLDMSFLLIPDPAYEQGEKLAATVRLENLEPEVAMEPSEATAVQGAVRVLINLCLYLAQDCRVRERGEREGGLCRKKHSLGLRPSIWVLGREVKLAPALIEAAKTVGGMSAQDRKRWVLQSRFVVRGHWREQVHGPRRRTDEGGFTPWLERRRRWIEPYWKGPEGEIVQRIAVMGEKVG